MDLDKLIAEKKAEVDSYSEAVSMYQREIQKLQGQLQKTVDQGLMAQGALDQLKAMKEGDSPVKKVS